MATAIKLEEITIATTDSGNTVFSVDVCGETPQAIFVTSVSTTTLETKVDDCHISIGASDGTRHGCVATYEEDNNVNWNTQGRQSTTEVYMKFDNSATPVIETSVSWDGTAAADSFTLQVDDAPPADVFLNVLVFAGFTNAPYLKQYTVTTGGYSPNQSKTGVGFNPDAGICFSAGSTSTSSGNTTECKLSYGFAVDNGAEGSKDQGSHGLYSSESGENAQTACYLGTSEDTCIMLPDSGTGVDFRHGIYTFDADGFTIYRHNDPGTDRVGWVLCIDEIDADYSVLTSPTSGTDQKVDTGSLGFDPHYVGYIGLGFTTDAGTSTHSQLRLGQAFYPGVGPKSTWAYHAVGRDAATSDAYRHYYDDVLHISNSQYVSDLTDLTEVNWTTTDGYARKMGAFSIAPSASDCDPDDPNAAPAADGQAMASLLMMIGRHTAWMILVYAKKTFDFIIPSIG